MNIRIFAGGALAAPQPHGREAQITRNADVALEHARAESLLAALPEGQGSRAQAALRFGLAHPDVSGVDWGWRNYLIWRKPWKPPPWAQWAMMSSPRYSPFGIVA